MGIVNMNELFKGQENSGVEYGTWIDIGGDGNKE